MNLSLLPGNASVNEQRQARGDCFSSLLLHAANNY